MSRSGPPGSSLKGLLRAVRSARSAAGGRPTTLIEHDEQEATHDEREDSCGEGVAAGGHIHAGIRQVRQGFPGLVRDVSRDVGVASIGHVRLGKGGQCVGVATVVTTTDDRRSTATVAGVVPAVVATISGVLATVTTTVSGGARQVDLRDHAIRAIGEFDEDVMQTARVREGTELVARLRVRQNLGEVPVHEEVDRHRALGITLVHGDVVDDGAGTIRSRVHLGTERGAGVGGTRNREIHGVAVTRRAREADGEGCGLGTTAEQEAPALGTCGLEDLSCTGHALVLDGDRGRFIDVAGHREGVGDASLPSGHVGLVIRQPDVRRDAELIRVSPTGVDTRDGDRLGRGLRSAHDGSREVDRVGSARIRERAALGSVLREGHRVLNPERAGDDDIHGGLLAGLHRQIVRQAIPTG